MSIIEIVSGLAALILAAYLVLEVAPVVTSSWGHVAIYSIAVILVVIVFVYAAGVLMHSRKRVKGGARDPGSGLGGGLGINSQNIRGIFEALGLVSPRTASGPSVDQQSAEEQVRKMEKERATKVKPIIKAQKEIAEQTLKQKQTAKFDPSMQEQFGLPKISEQQPALSSALNVDSGHDRGLSDRLFSALGLTSDSNVKSAIEEFKLLSEVIGLDSDYTQQALRGIKMLNEEAEKIMQERSANEVRLNGLEADSPEFDRLKGEIDALNSKLGTLLSDIDRESEKFKNRISEVNNMKIVVQELSDRIDYDQKYIVKLEQHASSEKKRNKFLAEEIQKKKYTVDLLEKEIQERKDTITEVTEERDTTVDLLEKELQERKDALAELTEERDTTVDLLEKELQERKDALAELTEERDTTVDLLEKEIQEKKDALVEVTEERDTTVDLLQQEVEVANLQYMMAVLALVLTLFLGFRSQRQILRKAERDRHTDNLFEMAEQGRVDQAISKINSGMYPTAVELANKIDELLEERKELKKLLERARGHRRLKLTGDLQKNVDMQKYYTGLYLQWWSYMVKARNTLFIMNTTRDKLATDIEMQSQMSEILDKTYPDDSREEHSMIAGIVTGTSNVSELAEKLGDRSTPSDRPSNELPVPPLLSGDDVASSVDGALAVPQDSPDDDQDDTMSLSDRIKALELQKKNDGASGAPSSPLPNSAPRLAKPPPGAPVPPPPPPRLGPTGPTGANMPPPPPPSYADRRKSGGMITDYIFQQLQTKTPSDFAAELRLGRHKQLSDRFSMDKAMLSECFKIIAPNTTLVSEASIDKAGYAMQMLSVLELFAAIKGYEYDHKIMAAACKKVSYDNRFVINDFLFEINDICRSMQDIDFSKMKSEAIGDTIFGLMSETKKIMTEVPRVTSNDELIKKVIGLYMAPDQSCPILKDLACSLKNIKRVMDEALTMSSNDGSEQLTAVLARKLGEREDLANKPSVGTKRQPITQIFAREDPNALFDGGVSKKNKKMVMLIGLKFRNVMNNLFKRKLEPDAPDPEPMQARGAVVIQALTEFFQGMRSDSGHEVLKINEEFLQKLSKQFEKAGITYSTWEDEGEKDFDADDREGNETMLDLHRARCSLVYYTLTEHLPLLIRSVWFFVNRGNLCSKAPMTHIELTSRTLEKIKNITEEISVENAQPVFKDKQTKKRQLSIAPNVEQLVESLQIDITGSAEVWTHIALLTSFKELRTMHNDWEKMRSAVGSFLNLTHDEAKSAQIETIRRYATQALTHKEIMAALKPNVETNTALIQLANKIVTDGTSEIEYQKSLERLNNTLKDACGDKVSAYETVRLYMSDVMKKYMSATLKCCALVADYCRFQKEREEDIIDAGKRVQRCIDWLKYNDTLELWIKWGLTMERKTPANRAAAAIKKYRDTEMAFGMVALLQKVKLEEERRKEEEAKQRLQKRKSKARDTLGAKEAVKSIKTDLKGVMQNQTTPPAPDSYKQALSITEAIQDRRHVIPDNSDEDENYDGDWGDLDA